MLWLKESISLRCGWKKPLLLLQDLAGKVESLGDAQCQRKSFLFGSHFEYVAVEDIIWGENGKENK